MASKLSIVFVIICAGFPSLSATGPGMDRPRIPLTVSVFNDARVPQTVLQAARRRADAVFREAGIALTWLDCGTPGQWHSDRGCLAVAFPEHLSVRLVEGRRVPSADIYGQSYLNAQGEGNYANVYVTPLASSKALVLVKEGDLLGYVVVHELGHLLLGKDSHSPEGLMRAKWQLSELREAAAGTLGFKPGEADLMRSRYLSARMARLKTAAPAASIGK